MFTPEDTLDFHDYGPISEAEVGSYLISFLETSSESGYKQVLIITGVGKNSPKAPLIKPTVKKLLSKNPLVKSFKPSEAFYGGEGAFAVDLL